ncbi:tudor domain-containing protein 5 isoform X2 [Tachysurus fulvidraco]|uniref:tudor domain-containing protein 5 isoform X2 n=1 Tax=Tachysurus fulvidraco TaxID=1234273 RepID=UPI001FEFB654|nr:tudor domain-containing protein 5 isoform X2 [Tachysurus fulvidraco]
MMLIAMRVIVPSAVTQSWSDFSVGVIMDTEKLLLRVKKDVRSLLISSKHGLSPEQLRKDYQNMLGHPIPLRALGFHSVLDMVKEMPDAVHFDFNLDGTIVLKAIGNETTRGIEELVSKQRNHKHKPKPKSGYTGLFSSHSHHKHSFFLARRGHAPPAVHAPLRSQLRQLLAHGPVRLSDLERCYAIHFGKPLNVMHYGFYSIAEMLAATSDMITVKQTRMGSQLILKTEITQVKRKLSSTAALPKQSAGISRVSTSSVLQETALFSQVQPEGQQKSKQTSASRVQEIEHATIEMKEKSFEKSVAKLERELRKRILENSEAGTVSQELKDKLRKVVAKHTQGIAIHKLPTEYKKTYGEDLPVAQCGFLSVTEMFETLSDKFCVQPSTVDGAEGIHIMVLKPHVQPAVSMNPSTEGHYFSCSETAWECQDDRGESTESLDSNSEFKITNRIIHQTGNIFPVTVLSTRGSVVPLDALRCQKLKPPTCRRYRDLVPVVVERIESPSHFYIRSVEDHRILENMMIEMRSCYFCPEVAERYQLPDAYVRPGQVCCVAPSDMWFYRVVIHRLLSATEVEVYYADFGDLSVVNRNKLKFLKSCYAELPAQAVPSVLVGVRPVKVLEQFNPVTLYIGDSQLEEVKEHFTAVTSSSVRNGQNLTHLQPDVSTVLSQHLTGAQENQQQEMAFLDLPELEFIDVDQSENSIPFESLLKNDPECFLNWDEGWTNMASVDEESNRLQNGKGESAKTALLSPVPFIKPDLETKAVFDSNHTQKPASSLHTHSKIKLQA